MSDDKQRRNGKKQPRNYRKSGFYSIRKLDVKRWPQGMRTAFDERLQELQEMPHFDLARDRGLILQVVYWETIGNILRQQIAETGPINVDGNLENIVKELRLIDATLLKLYQAAGLSPFVARQLLDAAPREKSVSEWLSEVAPADMSDVEDKESDTAPDQNGSDGDSTATVGDSEAKDGTDA